MVRTCCVRASRHLSAKHKAIIVTTDKREVAGTPANRHRASVDTICAILAEVILHSRCESAHADGCDYTRDAADVR